MNCVLPTCMQPGCRLHGSCSALFPQKLHEECLPFLDPANRRYRYFRLREQDRFIGPYHPLVLLLWNAHMNIQRITHAAWSLYLLKYAMKVRIASMNSHQSLSKDCYLKDGLASAVVKQFPITTQEHKHCKKPCILSCHEYTPRNGL